MALTYCFESSPIPRTLERCRKNDLAVVDTEWLAYCDAKYNYSAT